VIQLAITVIVLVAIIAIVYWFINHSGIAIPRPFLIAIYAVIAILAILFLASLAGVGPRWI